MTSGAGMSLRDLNEHQLKDLDRPERLFQVVAEGVASEFPPLRTEDAPTAYSGLEDELAAAAQAGSVSPPRVSGACSLPGLAGLAILAAAVAIVASREGAARKSIWPSNRTRRSCWMRHTARSSARYASVPGPCASQPGDGALWVANGSAATVSRIDPCNEGGRADDQCRLRAGRDRGG